ncbi:MAG TPA: thioredoxin domain-containing protein, partial [Chthoniobacterales bacterium]|nr:thioredoxin domain-containing protein [Chthoniobacterales bacterium]
MAADARSSAPRERGNRLAHEKSPYLLQHADNPVDWMPWNEEAFAKARAENKAIFLSIGYSTCHWCHVMAHESFEDHATAEIMNREFVNIKVDREERPDVDRVYMTFVQATTGHGGWPMSVWLTPDLKPFVGGTYFPPEDRYGHPGFRKVLERIAAAWKQDREKIAAQATQIAETLREAASGDKREAANLGADTLEAAYQQIARSYDPQEGGFGGAPKFPRPVTLNFLFRIFARGRVAQVSNLPATDSATWKVAPPAKQALEMNLFTLRKMAAGGMHDHVGGGFSRYSVDAFWHVPHFEKMLYDNGQLAVAYADAFQITREPLFEEVTRDILDYVRRDMTAPEGGFYSAEDADSIIEHGKPAHAEGAFYVWTQAEIEAALGGDAEVFNFHYGVEPHGNAPAGADPHGEFTGKNILIQRHTITETARHFDRGEEEVSRVLSEARCKLFGLRAKRPRPHLDDKIITAWNGLMISGFARAAQVVDECDYVAAAEHAAAFIRSHLYDESTKTLVRNYREGRSAAKGFADDYAFVIQGLLDLYEASFNVEWLKFAIDLQETQDRLFYDAENGGYFSGAGTDPSILFR